MDFNVDKQQLCVCKIVREAKAEQGIDSDITLPDYCPDIKSIIRCSIEPGISAVNITGNRVTAEGNAVIRLVYVSEGGKLACFEQNYPLSKYVEMSGLTQDSEIVTACTVGYVNCRAVSPRRVDVHGCISVVFSLVSCESTDFLTSASGDGIQLKLKPFNGCSAVGFTSKLFEMSEVVPISVSDSPIKSVLNATALPLLTQVKAVSNKLLLKGELQLSAWLCCENSSVVRVDHSMPISRIVELAGINEESVCDVNVNVSSLDLQLKPDENGEIKSIDAAVCMCADVCGYKVLSCAYVEDMYSLRNETQLKFSAIEENRFVKQLDENFLVPFTADFSGVEVGEIIDSWCDSVTCVSAANDDGLELSGTVTVCVLYLDSDGKPTMAQRQSDYRFGADLSPSGGKLSCNASVKPCGVTVSGKGSSVNVRAQLRAHGCVFESRGITAVSAAECTQTEKNRDTCPITVYFTDSGETLWDIAKKYNTSEEAIRRQNCVKSDVFETETMLIIPQV